MQLSSHEVADLIATAEDSFNDLCTIHADSGTTRDEYGQETDTFTDTEEVPCGYLPREQFQTERGQAVTLDVDALLRVSLTQPVGARDEITVRGIRYSVDGVVDGRTVRIVSLKSISTEE
jgi:SPP1 family predicted phage head-tail adaptor